MFLSVAGPEVHCSVVYGSSQLSLLPHTHLIATPTLLMKGRGGEEQVPIHYKGHGMFHKMLLPSPYLPLFHNNGAVFSESKEGKKKQLTAW